MDSAKVALPSLRTVNARLTPAPPCVTLPKWVPSAVLGVVSPSLMFWPLPSTATSGAVGTVTVPVILKLNGFSSLSLVSKLICPLFVPATAVSNRTVTASVSPGARLLGVLSVTVKPVGALTAPNVRATLPSFRTTYVRVTAAPPCVTLPKSVPLTELGVVSPSAML